VKKFTQLVGEVKMLEGFSTIGKISAIIIFCFFIITAIAFLFAGTQIATGQKSFSDFEDIAEKNGLAPTSINSNQQQNSKTNDLTIIENGKVNETYSINYFDKNYQATLLETTIAISQSSFDPKTYFALNFEIKFLNVYPVGDSNLIAKYPRLM
jgi:hypothetical protein